MIYELSVVCRGDAGDDVVASVNAMVKEVLDAEKGAELLVQDNWGRLTLAQPTSAGETKGTYLYYMFQSPGQSNVELGRRLGINEGVSRHMIFVIGEDRFKDQIVKGLKTPYSKVYRGSVVDVKDGEEGPEAGEDMDKDRRKFSKRKSCWFTAKKIRADWKDPATYSWLINEFGKISPSRVSGIARKHQRFATDAIKRARQLGISSHLSNRFAE